MRSLRYALPLLALALLSAPGRTDDKKFELEKGFTLLFNGKNLDGWKEAKTKDGKSLDGKTKAFEGRIEVTDGKLVYDPKVKGDRYIETSKEFAKDVTIRFDFKAGPKCNNDIFIRGTKFDIVPEKGETKDVKEGEWYAFEIVVTDAKVEHKINGKRVRTTTKVGKASPLMLRAEFGVIEIKNIRAKE